MISKSGVVPWLSDQIEKWDDLAYEHDWPDWAFAPTWGVLRAICNRLGTHQAVDDHCGRPDHRYCWKCRERMPFSPIEPVS
jgi:hypothetical protein